jgi:hypothetical protein
MQPKLSTANTRMLNRSNCGLTIFFQNESPGPDQESNWLPAPKGPFQMAMRLYWPKEAALEGKWTAPPLISVK